MRHRFRVILIQALVLLLRSWQSLLTYGRVYRTTFIACLLVCMMTTGFLVRYADALYWLFKYGSGIIEVVAQTVGNALNTEFLWNNAGTIDGASGLTTTNGTTITLTGTLNATGGTVNLSSNTVDALSEVSDTIQSATDANSTDFAMVGSGFTGSNQCVQRNASGALETTGAACGEGGGGGTPGGSDTQLQRNDAGSFGAITGFVSDGIDITGTGDLTTSGTVTVGALVVEPSAIPTIPLSDSDLVAANKTAATITADCGTNCGDGTANVDVTFSAMIDGVMTPFISLDASEGTVDILGSLSESDTLQSVATRGRTVSDADSITDSVKITDGTLGWRIYTDATLGPTIEPYTVSSGNPLTANQRIIDGDSQLLRIQDGGNNTTCRTIADSGLTTFSSFESCGVSDGVRKPVAANTAATLTVTAAMSGRVMGNTDADAIEFDLPAVAVGLQYCFLDEAGGVITVDPNGTQVITFDGVAAAAGEAIVSTAGVGSMMCVLANSGGTAWFGWTQFGTWAEATP